MKKLLLHYLQGVIGLLGMGIEKFLMMKLKIIQKALVIFLRNKLLLLGQLHLKISSSTIQDKQQIDQFMLESNQKLLLEITFLLLFRQESELVLYQLMIKSFYYKEENNQNNNFNQGYQESLKLLFFQGIVIKQLNKLFI